MPSDASSGSSPAIRQALLSNQQGGCWGGRLRALLPSFSLGPSEGAPTAAAHASLNTWKTICLICALQRAWLLSRTLPGCHAFHPGIDGPHMMSGMESEELSSYLTSGGGQHS